MPTKRSLLPVLTLPAVAVTLLLAACGGGGSGGSAADAGGDGGAAAENVKPTRGGTIEYGHQQEPQCISGGWVEQAYISRQVLDSLVAQGDKGEPLPWLATSWKVSDDQLTWTFKLKEGVQFTDGTPLDAAAIKKNFETWLDPKTLNSTVFHYIGEYYKSSRAVDAQTFELTLAKPYSPLLNVLAQGYFGIHSPAGIDRGPEAECVQPIGTGAFKIDKWNRGQNVTFSRNPNYTSAPANAQHQGPAYADKLVWKFLKEPAVRYGSLTSGQPQVVYDIPSVDWAEANERYEVLKYTTPGRPVTLSLNTTRAPFDDKRVRQALAYGLDRENAVKNAFQGAAEFNGNPALSQSTPDYDAAVANAYPYDPDKANQLLDEAGWGRRNGDGIRTKDGQPLKAVVTYGAGSLINADGVTLLQTLQEQAKQVGFQLELKPLTQTQLFSGEFAGPDDYDATPGYWTSPTAGVLYITWRQNLKDRPNNFNAAFWNSPKLEDTIERANSSADPAEQQQLYGEAQKIVSDEAVAIGLYTRTSSLAVDSSKIRGVWQEASQGEPVFSDAFLVNP